MTDLDGSFPTAATESGGTATGLAGPFAVALPSAVAFWHSVSFWRPGASPNFALELGRVGVELQASLAVDVSIPPATSEDHRVPRDFR